MIYKLRKIKKKEEKKRIFKHLPENIFILELSNFNFKYRICRKY